MEKAYWKVRVKEIGGQKRERTYEIHTTTQIKAEAAAERGAEKEFGGAWLAVFVTGPQASPFRG